MAERWRTEADQVPALQLVEFPQEMMLVGKPTLVFRYDTGPVSVTTDDERIAPLGPTPDVNRIAWYARMALVQNCAHRLVSVRREKAPRRSPEGSACRSEWDFVIQVVTRLCGLASALRLRLRCRLFLAGSRSQKRCAADQFGIVVLDAITLGLTVA